MLRSYFGSGLVVWLALLASPLLAAETPVDVIPEDTSVVIRLKAPKATTEKIATLADKLQPGSGPQVRGLSQGIGQLISNVTLAGVDMESDWWVLVSLSTDAAPDVVFIIPAKNADEMEEALDDKLTFVKHDKWGIYSEDSESIDAIKELIEGDGEGKSIKGRANAKAKAVLEQGDLSIFANVESLAETYSEYLKTGKEQIHENLEKLAAAAGGEGNPAMTESVVKFYGEVLEGLLQGVEDTESLAVAFGIAADAITLEEFATVKPDTETAEFLKGSPGSDMKLLSSLPPSSLGYFGFRGDMKSLLKWGMGFTDAAGLDDEAKQGLQETLAEMEKLDFGAIAAAFDLGKLDEGALRAVSITEINNPKKMQELARKIIPLMAEIKTAGVTQKTELQPDAEKYGKYSADVTTVVQEFEESPAAEIQKKIVTAMFGPEGLTQRTIYLNDRIVQTAGGSKDDVAAILKRITESAATTATEKPAATSKTPPAASKTPPATSKTQPAAKSKTAAAEKPATMDKSDSPLLSTRKKFGAKLSLLVLIDLPTALIKGLKLAKESPDAEGLPLPKAESLDKLSVKPSFLGFAVAVEPDSVSLKTVIPTEQVQGVANLVRLVMSVQQGGGE